MFFIIFRIENFKQSTVILIVKIKFSCYRIEISHFIFAFLLIFVRTNIKKHLRQVIRSTTQSFIRECIPISCSGYLLDIYLKIQCSTFDMVYKLIHPATTSALFTRDRNHLTKRELFFIRVFRPTDTLRIRTGI